MFLRTTHTHYISIVRSYILKSQLLSPEIGTSSTRQIGLSVNRHCNLLSQIMMSNLCTGWFYQFLLIDFIICLPYLYSLLLLILVHANANAPCLISLISLDMVKCCWAHTISCFCVYCSFASSRNYYYYYNCYWYCCFCYCWCSVSIFTCLWFINYLNQNKC